MFKLSRKEVKKKEIKKGKNFKKKPYTILSSMAKFNIEFWL